MANEKLSDGIEYDASKFYFTADNAYPGIVQDRAVVEGDATDIVMTTQAAQSGSDGAGGDFRIKLGARDGIGGLSAFEVSRELTYNGNSFVAFTVTPGATAATATILDGGASAGLQINGLVIGSIAIDVLQLSNQATGYAITTSNVDTYGGIVVNQTTASQTFTLDNPTATSSAKMFVVMNRGSAAFTVDPLDGSGASVLVGALTNVIFFWDANGTWTTGQTANSSGVGGSVQVSNGAGGFTSGTDFTYGTGSGILSLPGGGSLRSAGNLNIDCSSTLSIAAALATELDIGRSGMQTVYIGPQAWLTGGGFNYPTGGTIGTAATTVDATPSYFVAQTTAGQTLTLPTPTAAASGQRVAISNTGSAAFTMLGRTVWPNTTLYALWNTSLTSWYPEAGASPSGVTGSVQLSDGAGNLTSDTDFTYNTGTNRLTFPAASTITSTGTITLSPVGLQFATDTIPVVDSMYSIGTATTRFVEIVSNQFSIYPSAGAVNASSVLLGGQLAFGAGGASSLDWRIRRTTVNSATALQIDDNSSTRWGLLTGTSVAFGSGVAAAITTGTDHVLIGKDAGASLTTQSRNTFVGCQAGQFVTDVDCVAVGWLALRNATTTARTVAIGVSCVGNGVLTGDDNTFIGTNVANVATSGSASVAIGSLALSSGVFTGVSDVMIGYLAGEKVSSGNYNVICGSLAGQNLTQGHFNTFLGYSTGATCTTGSGNICIGTGSDVNSASAQNRIAIGTNVSATVDSGIFWMPTTAVPANAATLQVMAFDTSSGQMGPVTSFGKWQVTAIKTSGYTAAYGEYVRCDPSGGAFAVTLPAASAATVGMTIRVVNTTTSTNAITITRAGSDTINGATTYAMSSANQSIDVVCTSSTTWNVS